MRQNHGGSKICFSIAKLSFASSLDILVMMAIPCTGGIMIKLTKQAGAELCQAQDKLVLAKPALPTTNLRLSSPRYNLRSPSNSKEIEVFFHFQKIDIIFHLPKY